MNGHASVALSSYQTNISLLAGLPRIDASIFPFHSLASVFTRAKHTLIISCTNQSTELGQFRSIESTLYQFLTSTLQKHDLP